MATGARLRRRALRRRGARASRVLRPEAGRPRRQRTRVRRLPHGDRQLPVVARHRRGEIPAAAIAAPVQSRARTIRCFARSTPTTSAINGEDAPATSATCVRTGSCGSRSRCRRTCGSSIRRPTCRRAETFVDVWRSVPTVNDVALTGPDDGHPWSARSERVRRIPDRCSSGDAAGAGAGGPHQSRTGENAPPPQLLDDLASFQRVLFTSHRVRTLAAAVARGHDAAARCGSSARPRSNDRARRYSSARARSVTAGPASRRRSHPTLPARHPLSRHLQPVSASGRHGDACAVRLRPVSAAARSQCAHLRDHAVGADAIPAAIPPDEVAAARIPGARC